ncbi:MAG: hypothetical protein ACM3O6_09565 [Acidobacteriota bacterium]
MGNVVVRLGLAALLSLSATAVAAQTPQRADRPEIKTGDLWIFQNRDLRTGERKDISFTVTGVNANGMVMETGGSTSGAWIFTRDWNPTERKTGTVVTEAYKPYWLCRQFPLQVGSTWETPFEVDVFGQFSKRVSNWRWKLRVVSVETVTVAAGTFQAFKIESQASFNSREGNKTWAGTQTETMWYAPAAKVIVKRELVQSAPTRNFEDRRAVELLSFKPAP